MRRGGIEPPTSTLLNDTVARFRAWRCLAEGALPTELPAQTSPVCYFRITVEQIRNVHAATYLLMAFGTLCPRAGAGGRI